MPDDEPGTTVREYAKKAANDAVSVCKQASEVRNVGVKESLDKISDRLAGIEKTLCTGKDALVTRVAVQEERHKDLQQRVDETKAYAIAISKRQWVAVGAAVSSLFLLMGTVAVAVAQYLLNKP